MLTGLLLVALGLVLTAPGVPLAVVLLVAVVSAVTGPSMDAVIRTIWRTIGTDAQQIKALHSYDSILEEFGYFAGPFLASVLVLSTGDRPALFTVVGAMVAGFCLALASPLVRSALLPRAGVGKAAGSTRAVRPATRRQRLLGALRVAAGPIAERDLQRIVLSLILMGTVFGIVGILAPALAAARGRSGEAGFIIACISLGGLVGALGYGSVSLTASLRRRHAALGLVFGVPLSFAFLAGQPWLLGVLLALGGLAVTPLYINAYLMMDEQISDDVIHEANTWVPVGNNVGYVLGISVAALLLPGGGTAACLIAVTVVALVLSAYSLTQVAAGAGKISAAGTPTPEPVAEYGPREVEDAGTPGVPGA